MLFYSNHWSLSPQHGCSNTVLSKRPTEKLAIEMCLHLISTGENYIYLFYLFIHFIYFLSLLSLWFCWRSRIKKKKKKKKNSHKRGWVGRKIFLKLFQSGDKVRSVGRRWRTSKQSFFFFFFFFFFCLMVFIGLIRQSVLMRSCIGILSKKAKFVFGGKNNFLYIVSRNSLKLI